MKEQYSPKQTAAMKARVRRMRAQYRKRMLAAIIIFFILGIVAGIFAYRWYAGRTPQVADASVPAVITPAPEQTEAPVQTPEAWAMPEDDGEEDLFSEEDEDTQADAGAELDAFPEVSAEDDMTEANVEEDAETSAEEAKGAEEAVSNAAQGEDEATEAGAEEQAQQTGVAPGEPLVPQPEEGKDNPAEAEETAETAETDDGEQTDAADAGTEEKAGAEETEVTETAETGENGAESGEAADAGEEEAPEETPEPTPVPDMNSEDVPEHDPEAEEAPEDYLEVPDENGIVEAEEGRALTNYSTQVVAIVPYGESFTYTTEIDGEGNARVEATDEPYETISLTQTMKSYMRPADFADKYSTQYKLQGDEAGAGFELILNDYTGSSTIVPQNVVDVSLRSESGNTVERGYQLMDAEIAGNYGVALNTNTPKMLYKRYPYSTNGEEMAYLVVTTYRGGDTQMILFQLESDEPEPEPETVYTILQRGIKSDEVLAMQNRLIELGYLTGNVDGTFGPKTEEAIKAAQAAFGQEQTGIADAAFQQKLFEGAAPNVDEATGYVTLSNGSTGDAVRRLQARLKELGYYTGRTDGGFGPMMESAVKKAQAAFGMEQTGIADSDFQQKAFEGAETPDTTAASGDPATLRNGSTGDAVVKLQLALREQGYYSGRADGGYGPNTVAAVKRAQAAFGMEQTGEADAAFQQRLYGTGEDAGSESEAGENTVG